MSYVIPANKSILVTSTLPEGVQPLFKGDRAACNRFASTYWANKTRKAAPAPAPAPAPVQEQLPVDVGPDAAELQRQLDSLKGHWNCHRSRATAIHNTLMTARRGSQEWKQAMNALALMGDRDR